MTNNLCEQIRVAYRRMEAVLRTNSKYSNEYTRAVRDYQYLLHLSDSSSEAQLAKN